MGDDAELYLEMEHAPFFWDLVEEYNTPKKRSSGSTRKKNTALLIDGENISHKKQKVFYLLSKNKVSCTLLAFMVCKRTSILKDGLKKLKNVG